MSPPQEPASPRRGSVLAIDDDPAIGRAFGRMLRADHDVVVLTDAEEALARIAGGERFDVILCDLMMPTMTGVEFYETLSERYPEEARKVVLVTGGAFSDPAREFVRTFPQLTLNKPVEAKALRGVVSEYVQRAR